MAGVLHLALCLLSLLNVHSAQSATAVVCTTAVRPYYYRSPTNNQQCFPCQNACGAGKYLQKECTSTGVTQKTVCAACNTCSANQFRVNKCTFLTKAQCSVCTQCAAGYYRTGACQKTRAGGNGVNAKCAPCKVCLTGFYQTRACTATQNRICTACRPACGNKQYEAVKCTPNSNRQCKALTCLKCPVGQYQVTACKKPNTKPVKCAACTKCGANQYEIQSCTTMTNRICDTCLPKCPNGYFQARTCGPFNRVCMRCSMCPSEQYQTKACSPTSYQDTQCKPCRNFCNYNNGLTAAGASKGVLYYETQSCSAVANRKCAAAKIPPKCLPSCPDGQTRTSSCRTAAKQPACKACSTCTAGSTYETTPCTTVTNRVCKPCTVCNPTTQFEIVPCTLLTNRVCSACRSACDAKHPATQTCNGKVNTVCSGQNWSAWGQCSAPCGQTGTQTRTRACSPPSATCPASGQQQQSCTTSCGPPTATGWASWSAFSPCSVTCGTGTQTRTRVCPVGRNCDSGPASYTTQCIQPSCQPSPCDGNNGGCAQICTDQNGFAVCSCQGGQVLAIDGISCTNSG